MDDKQVAVRSADVAAEVRAHLARRRVRHCAAAEVIGIGQASMSRRLAGEYPFTVVELLKLADHLNVDIRSFFPASKVMVS